MTRNATNGNGNRTGPGLAFRPGRILSTPGALAAMDDAGTDPRALLAMHLRGDFGQVDAEDGAANRAAIRGGGGRVLSSYNLGGGAVVWIITSFSDVPGEQHTTFLTPDEY